MFPQTITVLIVEFLFTGLTKKLRNKPVANALKLFLNVFGLGRRVSIDFAQQLTI